MKLLVAAILLFTLTTTARAEVSEVRVAMIYGMAYLPLQVMQAQRLIENNAKDAGIPDLNVTWSTLGGGQVMNDALLSGSVDFASGGVTPFVTLWAKTKGSYNVRSVGTMNSMPLFLNTNNPKINSLRDFTGKDKIALPAIKVSIQAVILQMAAEQVFGPGHAFDLDKLTVSMSHPNGLTALSSGVVTGHVTSPPFQYRELRNSNIHTVFNSYDVLGGPATFDLVWTTSKFRSANPKIYGAFAKALSEAIDWINNNKKEAAKLYITVSKDKGDTADDILKMLNDPDIKYTTTPHNIMKYVEFMHKIGSIKVKPESWKEMFFPNVYDQPGS